MSSLLLAAGIALVFTGLNAALGFTTVGLLASTMAVASLLYAGALWFGGRQRGRGALLFDRALKPISGGDLLAELPEAIREQVRAHARLALAGERVRFVADRRMFLATPVLSETGDVLYALLVEGAVADAQPKPVDLAVH